jgi:hypothetical protein
MRSEHVYGGDVAKVSHLSTSLGCFSTQVPARIQQSDVDFVTPYSTASYLTTGVETRTYVQCPPAIPLPEFAHRASARFRESSPTKIARCIVASRLL